MLDISDELKAFLEEIGLDAGYYATIVERHAEEIPSLLPDKPNMYLSIDRASVYAVECLDLRPHEHILDLCCAPGSKMVLAHAKLQNTGSYTGVDISLNRLCIARAFIRRYGINNARLFHCDGSLFSQGPLKVLSPKEDISNPNPNNLCGSDKLLHACTPFRRFPCVALQPSSYDKVLVDAPCSHDGSIKHMASLFTCGWKKQERRHFGRDTICALEVLQVSLLVNGMKLLKKGGLLIYSTCSLCPRQNSKTIHAALRMCPECFIVPLPHDSVFDGEDYGIIHPQSHGCGSLFICRIGKQIT